MLLGGRTAEEVIFGRISTGASDDIQKATDLAERFVTLYGMSDKLGPIAFERVQQAFLEGLSSPRRNISPAVSETIDQVVKELIDGAHAAARAVLESNRSLLETTAQQLLQNEVIEGQELQAILSQVKPPIQLEEWLCQGKATCVNTLRSLCPSSESYNGSESVEAAAPNN
jgi:cell division protease FtsH